MLVLMKTTMAGPGLNASPGQKVVVPDEIGKTLIDGGFATEVAGEVESASIEPPERAVMPKPRPKKGK